MRRIPDDPARAREPDRHAVVPEGRGPRCSSRCTDIAIAVSQSTAEFVINARQIPAEQGEGRLPRRAARGVQPRAHGRGDRAPPAPSSASRRTSSRSARSRGCTSRRATRISSTPRGCVAQRAAARAVLPRRRRAAARAARAAGARRSASAIGSSSPASRGTSRASLSAFDLSVFPSLWEGTPLTVFEALAMGKPIVATDADGLLDVLTDGRDALIVPKRDAAALADGDRLDDRRARPSARGSARGARETGRQYDIAAFVRKMERLYDAAARRVARDAPHGRARGGPVVPRRGSGARDRLASVAAPRARCRRPGPLAASSCSRCTAALALTVDFPRAAIGHPERRGDLLHDGPQPRRGRRPHVSPRGPRARVARVPVGPGRRVPQEGTRRQGCRSTAASAVRRRCERSPIRRPARLFYGKSFIYPLFAAPFVLAVRHQRLPAAPRAAARAGRRSAATCSCTRARRAIAVGAARRRVRDGVGRAGVLRLDHAGAVQLLARLLAYFCWLYKEVAAPRARRRAARAGCSARGSDLVGRGAARHRDVLEAVEPAPVRCRSSSGSCVAPAVARASWSPASVFGAVAGGLFGANMAISGEWNYQGGERQHLLLASIPFQDAGVAPSTSARARPRDEASDRHHSSTAGSSGPNLTHNLGYFFVGRYSGLVAVLLPGGVRARRVPRWRRGGVPAGSTSCSAAALAQILLFVIGPPYTWFGGGGSVGNRYFMGAYGVFLFLLPPIDVGAWLASSRGSSARSSPRSWCSTRSWPRSARRLRQARAARLAAGRADATSTTCRSTPTRHACGCGSATTPASATRVPDLLPRRQRVRARGATRASG